MVERITSSFAEMPTLCRSPSAPGLCQSPDSVNHGLGQSANSWVIQTVPPFQMIEIPIETWTGLSRL